MQCQVEIPCHQWSCELCLELPVLKKHKTSEFGVEREVGVTKGVTKVNISQ